MIQKIHIVDIGIGNVNALSRILKKLNYDHTIGNSENLIKKADYIILPGVGNFGTYVEELINQKCANEILRAFNQGKNIMGLCVGAQAFFESSEESLRVSGLGIIKGCVRKLSSSESWVVPRIGWDYIKEVSDMNYFTHNSMNNLQSAFFAHSYFFDPLNRKMITHWSGEDFLIPVGYKENNVSAYQFHPEKSHDVGISVIKNFINS